MQEIEKEIKVLFDTVSTLGVGYIREAFDTIFTEYPAIKSISWTQGTPAYNDGSPCYFITFTDPCSIYINDMLYGDTDEDFDACFSEVHDVFKEISDALKEISPEFLRRIFGDGTRVCISNTSDDIKTEEWECDY